MTLKKAIYPPLNSTVTRFAQWLSNYTQFTNPPRRFYPQSPPGGKNYYSLQPIQLPSQEISEQPIALEMNCVYVVEGEEVPTDEFWAIRFTIVPFPPTQVEVVAECNHDSAKGYFEQLLRAIQRRWSASPESIEVTATGTPIEMACEGAEGEITFASQGEPIAGEDVNDSVPVVEKTTVPLEPWDVYSHLRDLCNNDPRFSIWGNVKTDEDLEKVTIWHTQAITQGKSPAGRHGIIGTVQLLPAGSNTVIMFVARDALHHEKITDGGQTLFQEFIRCANKHFDELTRQQVQAEPPKRTRANAGDAEPPFPGSPKTREGRQKWRESFRVIREIREEYRKLYDDGDTDEPNPSYDDLRDALARMPEWKKKPCLSTVRRIVRFGDKHPLE